VVIGSESQIKWKLLEANNDSLLSRVDMGHAIMTRVDQVFFDQILEDETRTMILKAKCSKRVAFTKNVNI
jgi:hypothetical protein